MQLSQSSFLCLSLVLIGAVGAGAATIQPTGILVRVPTGSNNPGPAGGAQVPVATRIFKDDFFLQQLSFGSTTFVDTANFAAANALQVLSNRPQVNVEWGDLDDGADGNANPMARIGQPDSMKESVTPTIQDAGLLQVFNSLNLSEMTDGEGGAAHSFKVAFAASVTDNDDAADLIPEIVLFERGRNDSFDISLIIGGSFEDPVLSAPLRINSASFADLGLRVDTTEIGAAQGLGVGGFDLNDWGLTAGTAVSGFVYSGVGADLAGVFASGTLGRFGTPVPLAPAPVPIGGLLLLSGLGALGLRRLLLCQR